MGVTHNEHDEMTRLLCLLVVVLCSTLTRGTKPTELTRHGHGDSVDQSHTRALRSFIASVSPEPEVVSEHTSGHTFSKEIIETIASVSPEQKVVSEHTSGRTFSKEIKLEGKQDQVGWGKSGDAAIKRAFQQTIAQTLTDALPAQMTVAPGDIAISKMQHDSKPKKLTRGLAALSNMLLQEKPPAVQVHYNIRFSQDTGDDEATRDKAIYKALAALDEAIQTKPDHYMSALCTLMRSHCGEMCSCSRSYAESSQALAALDEAIPAESTAAAEPLPLSLWSEANTSTAAAESTPKPHAEPPARLTLEALKRDPPVRLPLEDSPVLTEGVKPLKTPFEGWSNGALIALSVGLVILLSGLVAAFLVIIWEDTVERDEPHLKSPGTPSKLDRRCWQIW